MLFKHLYKTLWAVLPVTTIGVRRRTTATTLGTRTSTMAIRTTTIRTTHSVFVLFGVLDRIIEGLAGNSCVRCPCFQIIEPMQQLSLFDGEPTAKPSVELSALYEAYFDCRRNKRNTRNALAFEVDYEANLIALQAEINDGSYQPGKSIAFIVNKPVKEKFSLLIFVTGWCTILLSRNSPHCLKKHLSMTVMPAVLVKERNLGCGVLTASFGNARGITVKIAMC